MVKIEDLKRKVAKQDTYENNKENVNPFGGKNNKGKVKLRDIYMDYEGKNQELNMSKMNTSSTNMSMIQEASFRVSQVFGKWFKSKQQTNNDNILTTEVLHDLGIQTTSSSSSK